MSKVFSPSKPKAQSVPMPEPLPPPPERTDEQTVALAEDQRKRFASTGGGRAATWLTQGGTQQGSAAVRFLGGAART